MSHSHNLKRGAIWGLDKSSRTERGVCTMHDKTMGRWEKGDKLYDMENRG